MIKVTAFAAAAAAAVVAMTLPFIQGKGRSRFGRRKFGELSI
jgi:hypothetical protein